MIGSYLRIPKIEVNVSSSCSLVEIYPQETMESTKGWTNQEWRTAQASGTQANALDRLLKLVKSFDKQDPAWISIATEKQITTQWNLLKNSSVDVKSLPLYGVPFSVKDNIDTVGFFTTAACPAFSYNPSADATVVRLLRQAGAIVVGKTNMDQFATGLVGTRSPFGRTPSSFSANHIAGGSSAGSATTVARGLVPFSLGTDTAGSGRVPAHLNNLIGLKPTRGIFSCKGVVPACRTLDCVSIFALTLSDAQLVFSLLAKYDPDDSYSRQLPDPVLSTFGRQPRFAIPDIPKWFNEVQNSHVYDAALKIFDDIGVELVPTDFSILYTLAACLYEGPWVAERYATLNDFIQTNSNDMDPTVYEIVKKAEDFSAADCFRHEYIRQDLLRKIANKFTEFDGLIVPTAPLNPTFVEVEAEPIAVNSKQGTYTNFVNLADFCALAIPAGFRRDGLPFGVTLISQKFNDHALMDLAERFLDPERLLGATQLTCKQGDKLDMDILKKFSTKVLPLVVVGSHLSGMSLNYQLLDVAGTLQRKTKTSPHYKLYALSNTLPAKPAIQRVSRTSEEGESIDVEIWDIPLEKVGYFLAMIPPPLAIGSIELQDGQWLKGFVCEEFGFTDAKDITQYGSWKAYMSQINS